MIIKFLKTYQHVVKSISKINNKFYFYLAIVRYSTTPTPNLYLIRQAITISFRSSTSIAAKWTAVTKTVLAAAIYEDLIEIVEDKLEN